MNDEEKKAIENVTEYLIKRNSDDIHESCKYNDLYGYVTMQFTPFGDNDLQILLNLIEKQDKIINKMAEWVAEDGRLGFNIKEVIEYFNE